MVIPTLSQPEIAVRLGLALLLGTLVGLERERGERAAGMRTHALVCLGSALIMIVSAYAFLPDFAHLSIVRMDPGRIAAQVVSGIGFLGAGTIILRREVVKGLTTAAGLWVVAGVGLACGGGMYFTAIAGAAGALIILAVLDPIEKRIFHRAQSILLRVRPAEGQLSAVRAAVQQSSVRLRSMILQAGWNEGEDTIRLDYFPTGNTNLDRLTERLRLIPGFVALEGVRLSAFSTEEEEIDEFDEYEEHGSGGASN